MKWSRKLRAFCSLMSMLDEIGQLKVIKGDNPYLLMRAVKKQRFTDEALRTMVTYKPPYRLDQVYYDAVKDYYQRYGFSCQICRLIVNNEEVVHPIILRLVKKNFDFLFFNGEKGGDEKLLTLLNSEDEELIDAFRDLNKILEILSDVMNDEDALQRVDVLDLRHEIRPLLPPKEIRVKIYNSTLNNFYFNALTKVEEWWVVNFYPSLY